MTPGQAVYEARMEAVWGSDWALCAPAYRDLSDPDRASWETTAQRLGALECTPLASEPAKTVVVTAATGDRQRFTADGWTVTAGALSVNRDGNAVAIYPAGAWLACYPGAAIADDEDDLDPDHATQATP